MKFDFSIKFEPSIKEKETFAKVKEKVKSVTEDVISCAKEKAEDVADIVDNMKTKSLKNEYFDFDSDYPIEKMDPEALYNYIIESTKNSQVVEFDILEEDEESFTYKMKVEKFTKKDSTNKEKTQCNNCPCKQEYCYECDGPACVCGKI